MKTNHYLFSIVLLLLFNCSKSIEKTETYYPPKIAQEPTVDNYFEIEITDPYRNIEKTEDSSVINWYKEQTKYTLRFLERIKNRDSFINQIYEIDNRKSFYIKRHHLTENENQFYLKKNVGDSYYKLFYKGATESEETLLFDPKLYKEETQLDYE